jgi:hypothetical protein
MKKTVLFTALLLFSLGAMAQNYDKSIGLRLGSSVGVTYKQFLSERNALEFFGDLHFINGTVLNVSGEYLWQWNIGDIDGFDWYVGPGVSLGMWLGDDSNVNLALNGIIGLEYKFATIPLALSVDYNPHFYFLHSAGFVGDYSALSVRYTF